MRVLIACEESQEVCKAFRALGHEAYSCDIQEPSGGHPEWHIQGDALKILSPGWLPDLAHDDQRWGIEFCTMDKAYHIVDQWDLLVAHPPCTHLAVSGARWFADGKKPRSLQDGAAAFFMAFVRADVPKIAIENPVSVMSTRYRKPDQIIHPWQFGHPEEKTTCLWLFGLPKLRPTDVVRDEMMSLPKKLREKNHYMSPGKDRAKLRSKTYPGIARAMAEQWGRVTMGIKTIGYKKARKEYFETLKARHERSLTYWIMLRKEASVHEGYEIDEKCSAHGAAIQYCQDAINALKMMEEAEDEQTNSADI